MKLTNSVLSMMFFFFLVFFNSCNKEGNSPEADFSYTINGRSVSFEDRSTHVESYSWNFGDGNTSTESNPSHTYGQDGSFEVSLKVTNEEGTASIVKEITVAEMVDPVDIGYTLAFKATGDTEPEFLLSVDDILNGEIDAIGTGLEQTGWRFYYPVGKTLFASGYSEDNQCAGYKNDGNGNITKVGEFIFENALEMFGSDGENLLAMEIPRAGFADRRLHFVDAQTSHVKKIVKSRIFENTVDSLIAWPTSLLVTNNKLFIPFHKLDAKGYFTTPDANKAYVAVYDYPNVGSEPVKIIEDSRTSNIGVNGMTTGLIKTDNGDVYSYSCGAEMAGFTPASTKPSGILKISANTDDFDSSYFLNVEEKTGGKLFWMDYAGGNKAIGRILTHDEGGAWGAYGRESFNQQLVIIDFELETVTEVANVPLHANRYTSPIFVEDGYAYVSIETSDDVHIYQVDINNASGKKGAKVNGKTVKGIFKL